MFKFFKSLEFVIWKIEIYLEFRISCLEFSRYVF